MTHREIEAERLTIYCTEADRAEGKPLFEWLLVQAKQMDMAGATVTRALAGFGQHRQVHHQHLFALADDLPMTVQIIDAAPRIDAYLDATTDALVGYTYIREKVRWHQPNK